LRLYYSPGACSVAVHIVLEELGVEYEAERVSILDGENLREPFLTVNPRGRLPALADGEGILGETSALLVHFALGAPEAGLLPAIGTHEFARCLEWLSWIGSTAHVHLMQFWRPHRIAPPDAPLEAIGQFARDLFRADCAEIEGTVGDPWFFGSRYTIVDPYLLFCYRQGNRIGLPMTELFPRFASWADRMMGRPAVFRIFEREGISLSGDLDRLAPQRPVAPLG